MTAGLGLDVPALAQMLLDGIVDHFTAAEPSARLPERRIIAAGNPRMVAWDCEQLVITMSGIGQGPAPGTGGEPRGTGRQISSMGVRHTVLVAQLVRSHPESPDGTTPPDAGEVTRAGLASMRDAGLLSQALIAVAARITGGLPKGSRATAGAVEALGPEGGYSGLEGSIAVTVGTLA